MPTTVNDLFDRLVAAVPDLGPIRDESIEDNGGLLPHLLMGDIVAWCEDHVDDRRDDVERVARIVADALRDGDEQTRNVVLVSFSEGIFPGTPLWDVVPESLRDTWSGPPA
ncbi:DUF7674 family protein [Jatrophihabitans sp. YIM 134969]